MNDKFNNLFKRDGSIINDNTWKKIGDNYEQYSIKHSPNYITSASCCIKTK